MTAVFDKSRDQDRKALNLKRHIDLKLKLKSVSINRQRIRVYLPFRQHLDTFNNVPFLIYLFIYLFFFILSVIAMRAFKKQVYLLSSDLWYQQQTVCFIMKLYLYCVFYCLYLSLL